MLSFEKPGQLLLYSFLAAVPPSIAQEMAMRLFYLGFILCLEIPSPNAVAVGKDLPVLPCVVFTRRKHDHFFCCFVVVVLQSICAQARLSSAELEATPQKGCLPSRAVSSKKGLDNEENIELEIPPQR